jgi:hypothetical protein
MCPNEITNVWGAYSENLQESFKKLDFASQKTKNEGDM